MVIIYVIMYVLVVYVILFFGFWYFYVRVFIKVCFLENRNIIKWFFVIWVFSIVFGILYFVLWFEILNIDV